MDKFAAIGKELGLTGEDLFNFVKEESEKAEEKERIERERADEKELRVREDRERQEKENMEREARNEERNMKRLELESAIREKELEVEMEKLKAKVDVGNSKTEVRAKLPKLPHFVENKDNIDAYLKRFERFAATAKWPKDQWATHLSALLQGKSLDVYSRLSATDAVDYDILKESLIKRYQLTEEGFRVKFRTSKMELGETAQQIVVRLEENVLRWMSLAKGEERFEGLKDLVLREQFMQSSSKNLQVLLKERKVSSVEEMAIFADQYVEAHGSITNPGKPIGQGKMTANDNSGLILKPHIFPEKGDRNRQCYVCRSGTHLAKDCPHKFVKSTKACALTESEQTFNARSNNPPLSSRGRHFHRRHFGKRGNYRAGYRGGQRGSQSGNQEYDDGEKQYSKDSSDVGCFVQERVVPSEESVILDVDCESPLVSGSCSDIKSRSRNMPVVDGYLGDRKIKVLRDSGCSSVAVRRDLVKANCLTGETQRCTLIDGTVRRFPIATITVDTAICSGSVRALCTEHPIYDLILGNIVGVRGPGELDKTWKKKCAVPEVEESEGKKEELNAVQTRGKKERDKLVHNLKVADCVNQVGVDEVKDKQKGDPSLAKARDKAKTKVPKVSESGATSWFETKNDVLFRRLQSRKVENGKLFKQLCVSESLRTQVLKLAHDSVMGGHLGIKKTSDKILSKCWWPGIQADVKRYCRSCDICQKTFPKGKVTKIPIGELPLIETPFARVAVDLIGPINPPSEKGNRFILTLVDYATRYPEAIALKRIDTETVAEALVDIDNYVDDILDHSDCWDIHLSSLKDLFGRLRAAKLTARPSKCMLGIQSLCFMGHVVGNGQIQPNPKKVKDIENCQKPATKKQVRSVLGLVGYYRKFIPHFSTVASVLTEMAKKGAPNVVVWSNEAESSFRSLIRYVTRAPILCLPDVDKLFTLRTDASDTGIGAVLMQETSGMKFPIAYASRKLLPRETRYSVVEKEGLAIVWGVQKFQQYIYGTELLLETDHAPLAYMNKTRLTHPRVMRWALSLQPYRFGVQVIKGAENVSADFLSRLQYSFNFF